MNGILLVDKPAGKTSHDIVDCIRRAAGTRRVGHTGTLDPGATGLLVLCIGTATRLSEHLTGLDKTYEGAMRLGLVSDSHDLDGKILEENPVPALTKDAIQCVCDKFVGKIMQAPPMISAVKVGGERLYKKARQGVEVERPARPVEVREFTVSRYEPPDAWIRVRCTRGTYVRSLCHEVGRILGCGALLAELRRTHVGNYAVDDAAPVAMFKSREDVAQRLIPIDDALALPSIVVKRSSRRAVLSGSPIGADDLLGACPVRQGWVQIKSDEGKLLALGQIHSEPPAPYIHPRRVFGE